MVEDIGGSLQAEEAEPLARSGNCNSDSDNLWSPKKIQPYIFPEICGKCSILCGMVVSSAGRISDDCNFSSVV
jgi:hypothetical protein